MTTIVLAWLLAGSDPGTATSLREETRARVLSEVKGELSSRCPTQCEVTAVDVKVAPRKPPPGTTPGFEELTPDVKDYVVESVDVAMMVDKRLPAEHRTVLKDLLERKLAGEGLKTTVHVTLTKMPLPPDLPSDKPAPPAAIPAPAAEPARREAGALDPALPLVGRTAGERLLDALPLLLGLLLCAGVVWYTLRQFARLLEPRIAGGQGSDQGLAPGTAGALAAAGKAGAAGRLDAKQIDKELAALRERIAESPALRRELFRAWIAEGRLDEVAQAVVLLGAGALAEVRAEPECEEGLEALDAHLAALEPDPSIETRARLLAQLKLRVLRAEVRQQTDALGDAVARLGAADEPAFAAALAAEDEEVEAGLLRHVPDRLSRAVFAARPAAEQARLLRAMLGPETCSRERLLDAAERVRARVAGQAAGQSARAARSAARLLETAEAPERRRVLAALRSADPDAYRRVLGELVTEETLGALPADVLGAALLRLDVGQAALALAGLGGPARMRILAGLPPQQARTLEEEAETLGGSGARQEVALRAAFAEVRRAALERRIDLYEVNHRAWREPHGQADEEAIA